MKGGDGGDKATNVDADGACKQRKIYLTFLAILRVKYIYLMYLMI